MLATKKRAIPVRVFLAVGLMMVLSSCTPPGPRALLRGENRIKERDFQAAIEYLDEAVRLLPNNAQAWNHLGLAYHYGGQPAKALEAYEHALVLDRNLSPACFNAGCLEMESGNYSLAVDFLTTYTSLQPRSTDGWLRLASAQTHWAAQSSGPERARLLEFARRSYEFVNRLHPSAEALNGLGLVSIYRGRSHDAIGFLDAALKVEPDYPPALLNLAVIYHERAADHRLALAKYREYLSLKNRPANYGAVELLARQIEQELAPPPPKIAPPANPAPPPTNSVVTPAPATNRPVRAIPPTNQPPPAIHVESKPVSEPKPRDASPPAAKAATRPPPPVVTGTQIVATLPMVVPVTRTAAPPPSVAASAPPPAPASVSVPTPAVSATNLALEARPKAEPPPPEVKHGFFSHLNPASWFAKKKKSPPPEIKPDPASNPPPTASQTPETEARPVEQPNIPRYHYLYPAKSSEGNRGEAAKYFADGVVEHQNRHYPEAVRLYEKATNLDPSYFEAYYNLGLAAHEKGDMAASLTAYEHAMAQNPGFKDLRFNFSLALLKGGYALDAANEFQQMLESAPEDPRLHLALGNIYAQKLGNETEARKHYLKVLELQSDHPQAAAIRTWLATHP